MIRGGHVPTYGHCYRHEGRVSGKVQQGGQPKVIPGLEAPDPCSNRPVRHFLRSRVAGQLSFRPPKHQKEDTNRYNYPGPMSFPSVLFSRLIRCRVENHILTSSYYEFGESFREDSA